MTGDGEGKGTTRIPEVEEIFGVKRHKNAVTMPAAGIALEKARTEGAVLKTLLDYALGEAGLGPGDVDGLIGMAKAGGSEKEKVAAYLEKIKDDRSY